MAFLPHTWNCNRESLNGATRSQFGVKWQNFLRPDGAWQGIDARPAQVGNVLQIANAPYKLEAPLTAAGDFRFEATVRYDIHRKAGIASAATGLVKRFPGAQPVAAQVDGYLIRYPLAMPSIGADIVIRPHEQKVNFLYEWQSLPVGSGPIECPVEFEFDGVPEVARRVGNRSIATSDAVLSEPLTWQANSNRGVTIKPAKVWDSLGRSATVQLRLRRIGRRLVGVKLVPRAFLVAAFADGAAWVRTDTTSTFYPDANAESTSVDGYIAFSGDDTWGNARSGVGSGGADDSSTSGAGARCAMSSTTNQYSYIGRCVFLFDTSTIADTDTVSGATISLFGQFSSASAEWDDSFSIVTSAPASDTALASADFTAFGDTNKGSSTYSSAGWNGAGYNDMSLSDLTLVSKTGRTKLGLRQFNDMAPTEPSSWADSSTIQLGQYFAEETGTGSDPKLVVTHAAAATGNKSNLMLLGIGG